MVATICDQGHCPCVQCLITAPQIPALGTAEDRILRQTQLHVESEECQQWVKDARNKLYREGYVITGDHVDGVLKDESLVPTLVCIFPINSSPLPPSNVGTELVYPVLVTIWL